MNGPLFNRVVAASRLSELIGPFAIARALLMVEVSPRELTPEKLARALPRIEHGLAVYLRGDELAGALDDVRALAR